jgi:hypothetical protein
MIEHENARPQVRDRANAVVNTLLFNRPFQVDALTTAEGPLAGAIYAAKSQEHTSDGTPVTDLLPLPLLDVIPPTARPYAIAGTFIFVGLFGRPAVKAFMSLPAEPAEPPTWPPTRKSITKGVNSYLDRTMIPHMVRAWRTGKPQVAA